MTAQMLRKSILQLAMQGKLAKQDPNDESASSLLELIFHNNGKSIKKGKLLAAFAEKSPSFEVPENWRWLRLGDFCSIYNGDSINATVKSEKYSTQCDGWSYIATKDVGFDHSINYDNGVIIPFQENTFKIAPEGSVLLCMEGGSAGRKISIVDRDVCFGNKLCCFTPEGVLNRYLFYYLQAPQFYSNFMDSKTGLIGGVGTTKLKGINVPIPPLAEQKRIVTEIEKYLPLIEEYEKNEIRLTKLDAEFPDKIRKSILQYAIQGKLTERNTSDEPAIDLLKRIRTERVRLIQAGKIKKEPSLPPITEEEIPFEIPDNWAWERIGNLFCVIRGSSPRPKGSPLYWSQNETAYNWITIKDISDYTENGFLQKTHEYLTENGSRLSTFVEKGELIIAVSGSTTGKFCRLGISGYIYDGLAAILNPQRIVSGDYLNVFFSWVYQILNSQKAGSAFPNINTDILKKTLIPIPPLAEQTRIVERVKEILAMCDELK